jgi:hypothetical protein
VRNHVQQRVQERLPFPGSSPVFARVPMMQLSWEDGIPPNAREDLN